ncbi:MAG: CinA family nicotinamide mononucleotide deamidase-related protein [Chlamydiae bacterium]|nr:CinA family nicotinamide mononucleotide deamidase-related protein [Chlamydiota bacterium]
MKVAILAIGNEVLQGQVVNTNSAFIAQKLRTLGYDISRHGVVGDDKHEIKSVLKALSEKNELIIVTGGLGPTIDDKTKNIVCELLKIPLEFREDIAQDIKERFGEIASLEEQSTVPKNGFILKNEIGTAPGFAFINAGKAMIFLPGVPEEMKQMFSFHALPFILEHFPLTEKKYQEEINFTLLPEIKVNSILKRFETPDLDIGIYPSHGILKVILSAQGSNQKQAKDKFARPKEALLNEFSEYVFHSDSGLIEEAVQNLFTLKKLKLATAESCSGGGLAFRLASFPGSSAYFLGSIVAYANEVKQKVLGVSESTLKHKGAVSVQAVKEMALGVFKLTDADYSIAISGIAGPTGGSAEKPVGTVCMAIAKKNEAIDAGVLHFQNNRKVIVDMAITFALGILYRRVAHNLFYFEP